MNLIGAFGCLSLRISVFCQATLERRAPAGELASLGFSRSSEFGFWRCALSISGQHPETYILLFRQSQTALLKDPACVFFSDTALADSRALFAPPPSSFESSRRPSISTGYGQRMLLIHEIDGLVGESDHAIIRSLGRTAASAARRLSPAVKALVPSSAYQYGDSRWDVRESGSMHDLETACGSSIFSRYFAVLLCRRRPYHLQLSQAAVSGWTRRRPLATQPLLARESHSTRITP